MSGMDDTRVTRGIIENATRAAEGAMTPEVKAGKVMKVLYLDDQGNSVGEFASQQLPENAFKGRMQGLQEPPVSLEQLVYLAEMHHTHSAAIEQKVADITGRGWTFEAHDDNDADPEERAALEEWFDSLTGDSEETTKEVMQAVWNDVETTGWGMFEVVRDTKNVVARIYHVPSHTCRAHVSGFKIAQVRGGKMVWFKRWGAKDKAGNPVEVDAITGSMTRVNDVASELFVIRKQSRRSSYYGIPGYVSAIGWITLALAARDDNLHFFANRREPRWAIILTNLAQQTTQGESMEEMIRRAFTVDMRSPHRNIIIPIEGEGKVEFQKMSADLKQDGSFGELMTKADSAILVAHRTPPDRVAWTLTGALGGSSGVMANRVYKDGVVTAGQEVLNSRLNTFISVEYPAFQGGQGDGGEKIVQPWKLKMQDLDVETDSDELALVERKFKADMLTLREARNAIGLEPLMDKKMIPDPEFTADPANPNAQAEMVPELDEEGNPIEEESPLNDLLYSQLPGVSKGGGGGSDPTGGTPPDVGTQPGDGSDGSPPDARDAALQVLTHDVRSVVRETRAMHERVEESLERLPAP